MNEFPVVARHHLENFEFIISEKIFHKQTIRKKRPLRDF